MDGPFTGSSKPRGSIDPAFDQAAHRRMPAQRQLTRGQSKTARRKTLSALALAPAPVATPQPGADGGTPAAELPCAAFSADARLKALVELAPKNNRDLRIAARAARRAVAFARCWPTGSRQATGNRCTLGLPVGAFERVLFGCAKHLSAAALAWCFASDVGRRAVHASLVVSIGAAGAAYFPWISLIGIGGCCQQPAQRPL